MEKENLAKIWESTTKVMNTARRTITAKAVRKEEKKERKAKEKDKEKTRSQRQIRVSGATASHVASGDTRRVRLARVRASCGGSSEFFREFSGAECSDHTCGCEDSSIDSRIQC